ncbi:MAG: hypothetical protein LBK99_06995 [Opitutaceae bacterium]|jgi:hypothetical protein|nr:hypothetical protein [Opitutaceae bacterium]
MRISYPYLPLLAFAIAFASAHKASATVVFEDDFTSYTAWSTGARPADAVWTVFGATAAAIVDGSTDSKFPDTYLRCSNRGVYVTLPKALTDDWDLTVTMALSAYKQLSWFGLTDETGKNGYYVAWDTSEEGQYNGQGFLRIGELGDTTPSATGNPGAYLTTAVKSGAIPVTANAGFNQFASVTLSWVAAIHTLECRVNGSLISSVSDSSVASFSRIYLEGGNQGYYGSVRLTTSAVPELASVAGIFAAIVLGICVFRKSMGRKHA